MNSDDGRERDQIEKCFALLWRECALECDPKDYRGIVDLATSRFIMLRERARLLCFAWEANHVEPASYALTAAIKALREAVRQCDRRDVTTP